MIDGDGKLKIAVVLASMSVEYAYETILGIREEAKKQNADIYIFNANVTTDETLKHNIGEYAIYSLIDYKAFDGIILFANLIQGFSVYNNVIENIKKSGVPTICIDSEIEGLYFAGVDNYQPMKDVVNHFIEKHHFTKINCIAGQDFNSDSRERLKAYCDALEDHGIPVEEKRIFKGAFTNEHGRMSAKKMLESEEGLPEAVVCVTDNLAIGARMVFESKGIEMPKQLAFSGFDNVFEARNSIPRMTTVDRNQHVVGQEAVKKIVKCLRGEAIPMKERFPAKAVFRESCGCCCEDAESIDTIRQKYLETAEQYTKYLYVSNMMMEELTDTENFEEFLKKLGGYVSFLFEGGFYLCLDKCLADEMKRSDTALSADFHSMSVDYSISRVMSVVLGYDKGKAVSVKDFSSGQMLPDLEERGGEAHTYIFVPVHFRDNCMGYLVMDDCRFPLESPLFNTWVIDLCNCLESLRKQNYLKRMVSQLDQMCVVDALTGLYNRVGLDRYTEDSFQSCKREQKKFMLMFVDMDGLKYINDVYGHDHGDRAILAVSDALRNAGRGVEVCARYGGDEFVVYAEGYEESEAVEYRDRFQALLEEFNEENRELYRVGASCGYVIGVPREGDILDKYIDIADTYMYKQKIKKKEQSG